MSDRLFGRILRLPTALWIKEHPTGRFWQGEAALGVQSLLGLDRIDQGEVRKEIDRLCELVMVELLPREAGGSRQYYRRLDAALWDVIGAAAHVVDRVSDQQAPKACDTRLASPGP